MSVMFGEVSSNLTDHHSLFGRYFVCVDMSLHYFMFTLHNNVSKSGTSLSVTDGMWSACGSARRTGAAAGWIRLGAVQLSVLLRVRSDCYIPLRMDTDHYFPMASVNNALRYC